MQHSRVLIIVHHQDAHAGDSSASHLGLRGTLGVPLEPLVLVAYA